ncbi:MAG: amidohydrolase family protein [Acidimicrobiia bacterium]|nr:amidohydrolase family protein [Acidimicrobiia bacterium]
MPWDPDRELPIKLGPCSNGEERPVPLGPVELEAIRRTRRDAESLARRLGMDRRSFLRSLGGAALMLGTLAACHDDANKARNRRSGGTYRVPDDATTDPDVARGALAGDEFVFDVQTHYLDYDLTGPGTGIAGIDGLVNSFPQGRCGEADARACFSVEQYLDLLFNQSDTSLMILTAIPIPEPVNPLAMKDMEIARRLADQVCGDGRVLLHGGVQPTYGPAGQQIDGMAALARSHPIVGWKVYTHAPGDGWWLDDHDASSPQVGEEFLARVEAVGPNIVCVHKGFSGGSAYASPVDVGPAAKAHPDLRFVVYHSGFEAGVHEDAYSPDGRGVDRLVKSVRDAAVPAGANVYAELGSTWWNLMRDPTAAAHVLGKLLVAVGEDNVLWGTDSLWYGSPQDQIQAFRAFEISTELQERYGYPKLTARVKRKILGENALALYEVSAPTPRCEFSRDELAQARAAGGVALRTYGPETDREFRALLASHAVV